MRYLVTGATGFIGSALVDELVADDHEVLALTRDPDRATHLPDAIEVHEGDITEKESMREAMRDVDGVFHLAAWYQIGPGPWNREKARRINVEGTRNVLSLMDELDVKKGVYTSSVGVYGDTNGEFVDESYRSPKSFPSVYQETKWDAHYEVAEPMMEDGLPLVIATLGGIYGPGDKDYGGTPRTAIKGQLEGDLPIVPSDFELPMDYVEDTAANLKRAMDDGTPGEEYIIANEPHGVREMLEIVEALTGAPAPRALPGTMFSALGSAISVVETVMRPPDGFESELMEFFATGAIQVDNSKAKRELDIQHRTVREGLHETLEWELEQLDVDHELEEPIASA